MALSKIQNIGSQVVPNLGRRNLLYNGAMKIWQRGTDYDSAASGTFMCDRWRAGHSGLDGNFDWDKETTSTPEEFANALKISTDAVESSLDAADYIKVQQKLEGQDLQHLLKGTANAKKTTVSFWVKSSVASTYSFEITDNDNNRHINKSYTINSANTWEHKTLVFDGDTTGAWDNDNNTSCTMNWYIDAGTDYTSGTYATSWATIDNTNRVANTTGWLVASSREFYITGVQWEVGDNATDFEHRSFAEDLSLCQRYYYRINSIGTSDERNIGFSRSTTTCWVPYTFPVEMNHPPVLETSGTASHYAINIQSATVNCNSIPLNNSSGKEAMMIGWYVPTNSLNVGEANGLRFTNANAFLAFESEI